MSQNEWSQWECPIWRISAERRWVDGVDVIRVDGREYKYDSRLDELEAMDQGLREHFQEWLKKQWEKGVQCPSITQSIFDHECENYRRKLRGLGPTPPTIA